MAYVLPILELLLDKSLPECSNNETCQKPICLIVSPARELALQLYKEVIKFTKDSNVKAQIIYGGTSSAYQLMNLSRGADILGNI